MRKVEIKDITLKEEPETKEAKKLYKEHKTKYCFIVIIPLVLFIIFFLIVMSYQLNGIPEEKIYLIICLGISFLILIISLFIYFAKMRPFRKLLKIAKENDNIRHIERIKYRERKRLELEDKNEYTLKELKQTTKKTRS